jgi:hypothetical protein
VEGGGVKGEEHHPHHRPRVALATVEEHNGAPYDEQSHTHNAALLQQIEEVLPHALRERVARRRSTRRLTRDRTIAKEVCANISYGAVRGPVTIVVFSDAKLRIGREKGLARDDRKQPLNDGQILYTRGVRVAPLGTGYNPRGKKAGVSKRRRELISHPKSVRFATLSSLYE